MKKRVWAFLIVAAGSVAAGLFLPGSLLETVFNHCAYYFVFASALAWCFSLVRVLNGKLLLLVRNHYAALLLSILLMALIFNVSPPRFKVLADETNLVGTSMSMYFDRTVAIPNHGFGLEYYPFDYVCENIDSRPLVFPFAMFVLHSVFGYSPFHGFAVNFAAGVFALFVLYLLLGRVFGKPLGIVAMLLMSAFPVFVTCVTSSGFESINLFFITVVLYALFRFLEDRQADHAELLFFSLVMLSQCRYESAVFLLALAFLVPLFVKRELVPGYSPAVLLAPILLVPLLWQRRIGFLPPGVRLGVDGPTLVPQHTYAIGHLFENFSKNMFVLSGANPYYGFVLPVFIAASIGGYFVAKRLVTEFKNTDLKYRVIVGYGALCCVALFVIYSSYIWGVFTLGMDNRLSLAFLPFIIAPAVYWLFLIARGRSSHTRFLIIMAVSLVLFYWPFGVRQPLVKTKSVTYLYNRVVGLLYDRYDPKREHILLVTDWPNLYTVHNIGAIGFDEAKNMKERIRYLDDIYYDRILVSQRCSPETGLPIEQNRVDDLFDLAPVGRIDVGPEFYVLLSEARISGSRKTKGQGLERHSPGK